MVLCVFVCRYAASVKDGSQYFVLLIITDGVISDMAQAKESIVNVRVTPDSTLRLMHPTQFIKESSLTWSDGMAITTLKA